MARRKKKQLLPSSSIVTQSNELVSARYVLPLSEQRLVLTMIARIQPDDEDFKPYRISIAELAEFLGVDKNSSYRECKKITKNLMTRVLEIQEPGRLLQTNWVSSADYIDGTGMVKLTFDPLLKPYLLQLKGNFTSCKLEMLLSFKSQYTMRMYTFLKQYERLKEREIELEQLREILGLRKDIHAAYRNFKANVLKPIQKELAEKSDLYFEFEEIKYGRGVGALLIQIFTRNLSLPAEVTLAPAPEKIIQPDVIETSLLEKLLLLVPEPHRSKKTVYTVLTIFEKQKGFEYVKRNIAYSNEKAAKSYAGFLSNALKEDWGHDWELDKKQAQPKRVRPLWEREGFTSEKAYNDFMYQERMDRYTKGKSKNNVS